MQNRFSIKVLGLIGDFLSISGYITIIAMRDGNPNFNVTITFHDRTGTGILYSSFNEDKTFSYTASSDITSTNSLKSKPAV